MQYYIKTFGCQMNHSDSERVAAVLEKKSPSNSPFYKGGWFAPTADIHAADLVIFNTCGVRQMAEDRAYGQIHNLKKNKPVVKIVLTGCLANRKDVQRRLKNKVDLFFPINNLKEFENWIIKTCLKIENLKLKIAEQKNSILIKKNIDYLSISPRYSNSFSASVPIMTGCNNFCAYCVVPHARGREISRPPEEIITEVKELIKKGFKHIILLGQNVNSYQFQIQNNKSPINSKFKNTKYKIPATRNFNFSNLLKKINAIPGNFWISFTSNHPKDVTDEMIETATKCKKVCECFHLPVQSGSDEIIRKMNRRYTAKEYLKIVAKIKKAYRKHKPGAPFAITSDIIVGFPGETRRQFLASAEVMKKAKYDMVYFGQYSPRPGTAAWQLKDNVSKTEKVRRETYLNEILKKTALANNKKYVRKTLEVLVEKQEHSPSSQIPLNPPFSKREAVYFGKTRTMKNIRLGSEKKNLIGKIIRIKITRANIWNLEGEIKK